jgi:gamma-glutamyltranspeptidase/glutathione hydrolase
MHRLVRMLGYKQHLHATCDAPRWRYDAGLSVNVEHLMDARTGQELGSRSHAWTSSIKVTKNSGQAIS